MNQSTQRIIRNKIGLLDLLDVHLGFGFSADLFDYLLNFNIATRPLWLLPVGALYFVLYYALFRFFIVRFDLPTPGRERTAPATAASEGTGRRGEPAVRGCLHDPAAPGRSRQ